MTTNQFLHYHSLTQICESANSLIYRGLRDGDELPVVLKLMKSEYPSPAECTRYKQEYEILQSLQLAGVVKTYGLEPFQHRLVLVLEDMGGESLEQLSAKRQLSVVEILQVAIALAQSLGELHAHNIIHKDVNPANIVINTTTDPWQVKWIDFNIASVLPRENPTLSNPNVLEGTLPYLSPEQTGRMNRALDYRTDFYSLGVTLYQLLTQRLPFEAREALELIHCHLAVSPLSPQALKPELPKTLAAIVMKLLAKTAEERYQSAWGLKADLAECLKQFQTAGDLVEFPLGRYDVSPRFQLSQKLYGRESELQTLLAAFERITTGTLPHATTELLLISGYAGIGKSALVQELYKPLTQRRGYFIAGKCDQFQQNLPYFSLGLAVTDLVRQLLTESEVTLSGWREQFLTALGNQGQVIIDVIPEVERLSGATCGSQLGATEAQNRFHWVFLQMLKVVCQPAHPLVLFVDDLQWADSATLKLLEVLLSEEELSHLLVIGAYRDNEVSATHPLLMTLTRLKPTSATVQEVSLTPLTLASLTTWLTDSLHRDSATVGPLAELVMRKTQGNPFFVNEFMKMLYQEHLLTFRQPTSADSLTPLGELESGWQWTLADLEALVVTDNVVDLMLGKLRKLPATTQTVLGLAACLGNRFDLPILADLHGHSAIDTFQALQIALQEELIRPRSSLETTAASVLESPLLIHHYQFLHDRIHQAAYALLDPPRRQVVHLQIGRQLQVTVAANANASPHQQFELVDHLNEARSLLTTESERLELAHLNLLVGQQAKQTSAYLSAVHYLQIGRDLFTSTTDDWPSHPDLAFPLHRELAEALYLNGQFEAAEALIQHTLSLPPPFLLPLLNQVALYQLLIVLYTQLARYPEAIQTGRQALQLLGIDLPDTNLEQALATEMAAAQAQLENKAIASLIDLPELTNAEQKTTLQVLSALDVTTFIANPQLWMVVILKIVNMSLTHGNAAESACGYSNYGILKGLLQGDYNYSAYQFSWLALTLSEKFHDFYQKCKASFDFSFGVNPWTKHLKEADTINEEGYQAGLAAGKLQNAGYNLTYKIMSPFYQGKPLESLLTEFPPYLRFSQKTLNHWVTDCLLAFQLTTWNLSGLTANPTAFNTDQLTEENYLASSEAHQSGFALCTYQILKAQVGYLYGNPSDALVNLEQAANKLEFVSGFLQMAEYNFHHSLTLAALYPNVSETLQTEYGEKLVANQKQMKLWADNGPANFLHKYLLVAAEQARLAGRNEEALECYESAIAEATAQGFVQNAALANELAAKFWLGRRKPDIAAVYLKKAWYGYQQWGATRKVMLLEAQHPFLRTTPLATKDRDTYYTTTLRQTTTTTTGEAGEHLDLASVLKASQALAGEIVLSRLVDKLMRIVIENAGAQQGWLLLNLKGQWVIEAKATVKTHAHLAESGVEEVELLHTTLDSDNLPTTLIYYVARTQEPVVLHDAAQPSKFVKDTYFLRQSPKSVLCGPLLNQGQVTGIIYLENNLASGVFTPARLKVLNLLSSQMAISIENANLYNHLEEKVKERTRTIEAQKNELEATLRKLQTTQQQLVEAEKMAALGNLVAGIAHEINTPVGVCVTAASQLDKLTKDFASLYKSGGMTRPTLENYLNGAHQSSVMLSRNLNRAAELTKSFKQIAVDQTSEMMRKVVLKEYLQEILSTLKPEFKHTTHQAMVICEEKIEWTTDAGAVAQIITNLVINSLRHGFPNQTEGGQIKVEAMLTAAPGEDGKDRPWLTLRYSDNGKGIAADILPKIFEPFFTTNRQGGGTGLGLHIVYNLVAHKLKGNIRCESTLGQGAVFIMEMPLEN